MLQKERSGFNSGRQGVLPIYKPRRRLLAPGGSALRLYLPPTRKQRLRLEHTEQDPNRLLISPELTVPKSAEPAHSCHVLNVRTSIIAAVQVRWKVEERFVQAVLKAIPAWSMPLSELRPTLRLPIGQTDP